MTVYITLVIFCILFTWLQQIKLINHGLEISYLLVFLFLALRYDYGNDYSSYFGEYLELRNLQDQDFYYKSNEFGWLYLNYFFKLFFGDVGFHIMLACLSAFTCVVLYRFNVKYIPEKYYTFGLSLLLLEPNNILVLCSGIRQSLAVSIFLISFDFLVKRKYLNYAFGLFLGSLFHTSVLFFIVLIALNFVNWKIYLPYVIFILSVLFILFNNLTEIFDQVNIFLESQESEYAAYTDNGFEKQKIGLGFALSVFLSLSVLVVNARVNNPLMENTIIKMVIVALLILIFALSVRLSSRLGFYIFPATVSAYSLTLLELDKTKSAGYTLVTRLSTIIILFYFIYQNYIFWKSPVYSPYFMDYKTILQSPLIK